eukprot:gnl/MRDRNA2_/MRDRNA2_79183_c0_seq1.p1 gnl/MRDRNA2_/MRDRNA2_79183_c0~~gnl/MRDRNA2_/MRDRNA2_79183_c0_seq1.p1  ORF type:complete len:392 (-),score=53.79 gnl/MRDRNA2_/MRDRNA2_79183_c0_seq1:46-1221(-)
MQGCKLVVFIITTSLSFQLHHGLRRVNSKKRNEFRFNYRDAFQNPEATVFPQPGPEELGTPDQIVFDKNVWTPNCTDLFEFLPEFVQTLPRKEQEPARFNMNACLAYEQHRRMQYQDLGHRGLKKKDIYFLHVSKSAGTFFCACGMSNHENPGKNISDVENCHYLEEDGPWWGNSDSTPVWARYAKKHSDSWATYGMQMKEKGLTLEGNENYLPHGELSGDFENVIIVRDPIHRLASHVAFLKGSDGAKGMSLSQMTANWPWLTDNYLTRSLSGASVYQKEHGTLTEAEFQNAAKTIHSFDNIFVVDKDLTQELHHHYQWSCGNVQGRRNGAEGGTTSIVSYWHENWPTKDWKKLLELHKFDTKMFAEAQRKSKFNSFLRYLERRYHTIGT